MSFYSMFQKSYYQKLTTILWQAVIITIFTELMKTLLGIRQGTDASLDLS